MISRRPESWRSCTVAGYFLLVLAFLMIFFTQIHPLVVFDCDDWKYIAFARMPFPNLHEWNPTRIFPECFMPLTGYFAAYVLAPLIGDYLRAMTYAAAMGLSLLITGYLYLFYRLMRNGEEGHWRSICITTVFFALHFLILKVHPYDNHDLFWAFNLTCVFYYLMPTLMNASLVLWMMRRGRLTDAYGHLTAMQKGTLWVALYFAVFSDIMHNVVLIAFVGLSSLWDFWRGNAWRDIRAWGRSHRMELAVMMLWFICLFFEAHGGRAHDIAKPEMPWREAWGFAGQIWPAMKHSVVFVCLIAIFWAAVEVFRSDRTQQVQDLRHQMLLCFACIPLIFLYLFVLCTKANAWYIARTDVFFCYVFYFLLLAGLSLNAMVRRHPVMMQGMPLFAVLVLLTALNNPQQSFQESTVGNIPAQTCYDMGHDIIQQMVEADRTGEKMAVIHVAVGESVVNWPFSKVMEEDLPQTLFRHGLLQRPLKIQLQPDPEVNEKYHLAVPLQIVSKNPNLAPNAENH